MDKKRLPFKNQEEIIRCMEREIQQQKEVIRTQNEQIRSLKNQIKPNQTHPHFLLYITVKMYPCSGGTDTGSPEL